MNDARENEFAPAKINLALHVRRREADGYHALETLFVFADVGDSVGWCAPLESEITLAVEGPFAGGLDAGDNLVLRAARALSKALGCGTGAALTLNKRLPVASGLGGGSADAAATLRLLNRVWKLGLPLERLAEIGAVLGADVPACVHGTPQRGESRGERLSPVAFQGSAAVLVNPRVAVPTGPVFAAWDGKDRGPLAHGDAIAAARAGRNDLEPPACVIAPVVIEVLTELARVQGATLARMSGSGATCFALFQSDALATEASRRIAEAHPDWWTVPTRLNPPKPS